MVDVDELLDRALHMLAHGGYPALSMRGLARFFGVSLATVQNRFATKEILWRAAVDRTIAAPEMDELPSVDDFVENLQRQVVAAAAYPGLIPSLLADDSPGHEERNAYLAGRLGPPADSGRALIAAARDAGIVRDVDTGVLLAVLLVGVASVVALPAPLAEALGLDRDGRTIAEGLGDLLVNGILQRPFGPEG